ncbi:MAG: BamA/TamA family outer membrane protein [Candidatus Eisenbacteria bacterium]|nr:BamA/TamA family outer membrane protein [Candidatus Eisenbacteria bacterium]
MRRAALVLAVAVLGLPQAAQAHPGLSPGGALAEAASPWVLGIVRQPRDTTTAGGDSLSPAPPVPFPGDSLAPFGPRPDRRLDGLRRLRERLRHQREITLAGDYNRVDQLRLGARLTPRPPEPMYPRAELEASYSVGRGQWNYSVGLEQPLGLRPYIAVGGRIYRLTDSPDWTLLSRTENTLSALLLRQDYLDYFGRNGASAFARIAWGESGGLTAGFRSDDLVALRARTETWTLFGGDRKFRANPVYDAGVLHEVSAALWLSSRGGRPAPRPGVELHAEARAAGGFLGGDFGYSRAKVESRWTSKLAPGLWLNVRAAAGARLGGRLTAQDEFTVGGVGTLRGHEYKEQAGDRYYLLNVEYSMNLGQHVALLDRDETLRALELVLFTEVGHAWRAEGDPTRPAWDAGLGLQTGSDGFHVYAAQGLNAGHGGPRLSFRMNRTF